MPEPIDVSCIGIAAHERELSDGSVLLPMFWVAGVMLDENGDETVRAFTPLTHSAAKALADLAALMEAGWEGLEVLHVPRRCRPGVPKEQEWLEVNRPLAASQRARETQ